MNKKTKNSVQRAIDHLNGDLALSAHDEQELVKDLTSAIDENPWWMYLLKTLAYLIGLILAGVGTSATACTLFNI